MGEPSLSMTATGTVKTTDPRQLRPIRYNSSTNRCAWWIPRKRHHPDTVRYDLIRVLDALGRGTDSTTTSEPPGGGRGPEGQSTASNATALRQTRTVDPAVRPSSTATFCRVSEFELLGRPGAEHPTRRQPESVTDPGRTTRFEHDWCRPDRRVVIG